MVSFAKLAELSNGNVGFVGGTAHDSMPEMGLTECASAFSMYLCESIIEDFAAEEAQDDKLFEAACQAVESGDMAIFESATMLNEADGDGVWAKIKGVFQKIAEFFKSLVAKIGMWISSITKDDAAFYNKYADQFKNSGKTVVIKSGLYDFDGGKDAKNLDGVTAFDVMKELVSDLKDPANVSPDDARNITPKLKVDKVTINKHIKSKVSCPEDKKYPEFLRGNEKKDVKVSYASMNAFCKTALVDVGSLKALQAQYKAELAASNAQLKAVDAAARSRSDDNEGFIAKYMSAYATLYKMVANELNSFTKDQINCIKQMRAQAKRIMRAVISGKDSGAEDNAVKDEAKPEGEAKPEDKDNNAATESVDFDEFDFEF